MDRHSSFIFLTVGILAAFSGFGFENQNFGTYASILNHVIANLFLGLAVIIPLAVALQSEFSWKKTLLLCAGIVPLCLVLFLLAAFMFSWFSNFSGLDAIIIPILFVVYLAASLVLFGIGVFLLNRPKIAAAAMVVALVIPVLVYADDIIRIHRFATDKSMEIPPAGDFAMQEAHCSGINDGYIQGRCIDNAYYYQAMKNPDSIDPSWCNKIVGEKKGDCLAKAALQRGDSTLCAGIPNQLGKMRDCLSALAVQKNDPSLCRGLMGVDFNICMTMVALGADSIDVCQQIPVMYIGRDSCIKAIAQKRNDKSLCALMTSDEELMQLGLDVLIQNRETRSACEADFGFAS